MCFLAFVLGLLLGIIDFVIVAYMIGRADGKNAPPASGTSARQHDFVKNIDDLSEEYLHDLQELVEQLLTKGERK